MNNRAKLIAISFIPLIYGFIMNAMIMNLNIYGIPVFILSVLFMVIWYFSGAKSRQFSSKQIEATLFGNAVATLSIVWVIIQILYFKRFLPNIFGLISQISFMPLISIVSKLNIFSLFNTTTSIMISSYVLMVLIFFLGYKKANT